MTALPIPVELGAWKGGTSSHDPHRKATGDIRIFERLVMKQCRLYEKDGVFWIDLPRDCKWTSTVVGHRFNKHVVNLLRQAHPEIFGDPLPLAPRLRRHLTGGAR
jgi:hypothetical protein